MVSITPTVTPETLVRSDLVNLITDATNGHKASLTALLSRCSEIEFQYVPTSRSLMLGLNRNRDVKYLIDTPIYEKIKSILECCNQNTAIVLSSFSPDMIKAADALSVPDYSKISSITIRGEYTTTDLVDFAKCMSRTKLKSLIIHNLDASGREKPFMFDELTALISALNGSTITSLSVGISPYPILTEPTDKTLAEALKANSTITSLSVSYHYGNWLTTYHVAKQLKMNAEASSRSEGLFSTLLSSFRLQPNPRIQEVAHQTLYYPPETNSDG